MDITGRLVRLRPVRPDDAPRMVESLADPRVVYHLAHWALLPYSLEQAQQWVANDQPDALRWAIECLADGEYVGGTGLHNISHFNRHCAFGIWIGPPERWGRGYGTETCKLAVEYAFRHLAMEKVSLFVFSGNDRARRSYERAGFVSEGVMRREFWRDGGLVDVETMAVFRDNPVYAERIAISGA
jgi:RimJ/RimL family protein N-acetyltransferase